MLLRADNSSAKSKEQLMSKLSENMSLNTPSGLTLEQFKKVLSNNEKDKNKIFEQNAEYFYYIEKQYNINGLFVAAVGIHESAWGLQKFQQIKRIYLDMVQATVTHIIMLIHFQVIQRE